jgi:hypothetical protein
MSDKIVDLSGKPIEAVPPGEPVPSVIAMLEEALDEARNGKIVAVAIAKVGPTHEFAIPYRLTAAYRASLLGAAKLLADAIAIDILDGAWPQG